MFETVARPFLIGTIAYFALVALLRLSGKRTLAKWSAYDLVVTVAFGSTLATGIVSDSTSLGRTIVAFATLVALQSLVTRSYIRFPFLERAVKSRPALLLRDGEILWEALRAERVTEAEVLAALRGAGVGRVSDTAAVVLETDGNFSVIVRSSGGPIDTLADVEYS